MILPSKHLSQDRALLTVGAQILPRISQPRTVSSLWEELTRDTTKKQHSSLLRYDAFVLTLDLLFLIGAIQLRDGLLTRTKP
jgi:hypothetical protein